jgi:hypothetical protein
VSIVQAADATSLAGHHQLPRWLQYGALSYLGIAPADDAVLVALEPHVLHVSASSGCFDGLTETACPAASTLCGCIDGLMTANKHNIKHGSL